MRKIIWLGDSKEKLKEFPEEVRRDMGYALGFAQNGEKHPHAKPLKGFGSGVFEIVEDDKAGTFRTVYALQNCNSEDDMKKEKVFEESSGNIFKDLELPNPELENMKLELAIKIVSIINQKNKTLINAGKKKLTQIQIGKLLGIQQSEISKLKNGQYSRFSLERLLYFLARLHYNIDIKLSPSLGKYTYQRVILNSTKDKNSKLHPAGF